MGLGQVPGKKCVKFGAQTGTDQARTDRPETQTTADQLRCAKSWHEFATAGSLRLRYADMMVLRLNPNFPPLFRRLSQRCHKKFTSAGSPSDPKSSVCITLPYWCKLPMTPFSCVGPRQVNYSLVRCIFPSQQPLGHLNEGYQTMLV